MVLEHAVLPVTPGEEEAFAEDLKAALPIIRSAPGCRGAEVRREIEDPTKHLLLVTWDSVEAHNEFRNTDLYQQWRSLTHPHYTGKVGVDFFVTHFSEPLEG